MRRISCLFVGLALAICLLALPQGVLADSATWSNGATTFDYNTLSNWAAAPASIPGANAGETATFTDIGVGNVGISAATAFGVGFDFSNTAGNNYTITVADGVNQPLTGVTTTGTGDVTLAGAGAGTYTLAGTITFDIGAGQSTTVSSVITDGAGAGNLDKDGPGTLTLSGANTFTGGTTLTSGTLAANADNALGTGTLALNGGTLINNSGSGVTLSNPITVGGAATIGGTIPWPNGDLTFTGATVDLGANTLTNTNASDTTINGVISGTGGIVENGNDEFFNLNGANTYSGGTTLTLGYLGLGSNTALGTGDLTINGSNSGLFASVADVSVANHIVITPGNESTILNGVDDHNLTLSGSISLGSGSTLATYNLGDSGYNPITTLSGAITGEGGINEYGDYGTLVLSHTNTYTGGTTLNAGTLAANADDALGTGTLALNGGTLLNSSGAPVTLSNPITVGGAATIGGGGNLTFTGATVNLGANTLTNTNAGDTIINGVISGSGGIIQNSTVATGALILSGANTYSGGTILTSGTLGLGSNTALGTGDLTIVGPVTGLFAADSSASVGNHIDVESGNHVFILGAGSPNNFTLSGTIDLKGVGSAIYNENQGLDEDHPSVTTLSGQISGPAGYIYQDSGDYGLLVLSGANTYSGGTGLESGILVAGSSTVVGPGGDITSGPFGTADLGIHGGTLAASGSQTVANNINVLNNFSLGGRAGDNLTLTHDLDLGAHYLANYGADASTNTLTGEVSGTGGIVQTSGTLVLSGANTYSGDTTLDAGTLVAGSSSGAGSGPFGTGNLLISGGTLAAGGAAQTLNNNIAIANDFSLGTGAAPYNYDLTLSGAVSINVFNPYLTVNNTTEIQGVITDNGYGFTKAGPGTLILSGDNSTSIYEQTTVQAGTLRASGLDNRLGAVDSTVIDSAGTIDLTSTNQTFAALFGEGNLTGSGTITVNSGDFSGVISGAGSLVKDTTADLNLSGANTYSGGTTLNDGTLVAGSSSVVSGGAITSGPFGTGTLAIYGATLQADGSQTVANPITGGLHLGGNISDNLTLTGDITIPYLLFLENKGLGVNTLSGSISGAGSILQSSTGTLVLSGANTYTGDTVVYAGTLVAGSSSGVDSSGHLYGPFGIVGLYIKGGTLYASGSQTVDISYFIQSDFSIGGAAATDVLTLSGPGTLEGSYAIDVSGPGSSVLFGNIDDGGSGYGITLNSTGTGSLTLSGANTYSGGTTLNAGTLVAGSSSGAGFGPFGTGTLTINGGRVGASAANITVDNPLTIGGSFAMGGAAGTNLTLSQDMALGGNTLTHNQPSSDALSGNVTNGNINVTAGTLTLSGGGANSANVAANGGTLNLSGGAGTTFTGTATVNTGTLNLTGGTLSGATTISGGTFGLSAGSFTGNLTQTGGALNLTGGTFAPANAPNITTGAGTTTTIGSGTNLNLGGGILTNKGLVNGGGILTGNLFNNGTVSPGAPGAPGVLTVTNYTANPGSYTVFQIASFKSFSQIVGTGLITLNGGTITPTLLGGFIPKINQVFQVMQGNVVGTFTTLANAQITPTLFWKLLYNSVDLKAAGVYNGANLNLSPSQMTVGNMLNGFANVTSGDMFDVLNAISALTTVGEVQAAYNEILPLKYASLPSLTFPVTRLQFQYLRNRLARLRQGSEFAGETMAAGGSFMRSLAFGYDTNMLLASNRVASDAGNPLLRRGMTQRLGVYLDPLVNWGDQSTVSGQPGYHYTNAGFVLGADYWLTQNLVVGLNTGYNHTGTGIKGTGGSIDVNSIPFNAYSSYMFRNFYANAILGYTHNNYDLERNIVFGTINRRAKASTSGNQFQMAAETGYDFKVGNAIIGPTVSMYYLTLTTDGFTEEGAGALSLRVPSQTANSVQTGLGARAAYKAKVKNITVVPQAYAVWQHEYSDETRGVDARLAQGSSTIHFRTAEPGRNFAVLGFDLSAKFTKNIRANVGYTAEVGRSNSNNMGVNVGLRINF